MYCLVQGFSLTRLCRQISINHAQLHIELNILLLKTGVGGTNNSAVQVAFPHEFSAFNVYLPTSS